MLSLNPGLFFRSNIASLKDSGLALSQNRQCFPSLNRLVYTGYFAVRSGLRKAIISKILSEMHLSNCSVSPKIPRQISAFAATRGISSLGIRPFKTKFLRFNSLCKPSICLRACPRPYNSNRISVSPSNNFAAFNIYSMPVTKYISTPEHYPKDIVFIFFGMGIKKVVICRKINKTQFRLTDIKMFFKKI